MVTLVLVHQLTPPLQAELKSAPGYTLAQVAEHNCEQDCWIIIDNKVYDISSYIPQHPAPPSILTQCCGKEASEAMRTKGYGRDHSPATWGMLDAYHIGLLVDAES